MRIDFPALADEFIAKVRAATITGSTEVNTVYYCVDADGNDVPPFRMELAPLTTVKAPGNIEWAKKFAAKDHLESIIDNINSLIRPSTPERFFIPRDAPQIPKILKRVELEIVDI